MSFQTESHGDTHASDLDLCKAIFTELHGHYPNHPWMIGVNHESGAADIRLAYPNRFGRCANLGFLIHLTSFKDSGWVKKVVMAGGELLERYKLDRAGATPETALLAAMNGIDRAGEIR